MSDCGLSVCGQSVCVRVCDYAAKPFCAASYFLGAAPSKTRVKQHSDTNHLANVGQGSAGTFRSSAEVSRSVTASAVYSRSGIASPTTILDKRKTPDGFVDSWRFDSVCLRQTLFPNPYMLSQKVT